ncbi:MAG TPA: MarR family winged helix-turn-helix transcriptional regulator [Terriglobales bacterium]|nr:MarR family winged helix-turn-helix transcriptional regulator [Terriglobales bacterium]
MNIVDSSLIPKDILQDSILARIAAAYFSVGKKLERKTQCSATRGFVLSALRSGAALNQNQIAKLLGLDRTVVHRSIKLMAREGLVSESTARTGKGILVRLTPKGQRYREFLIKERRAADEKLGRELRPEERSTLLRLLKLVAEVEL